MTLRLSIAMIFSTKLSFRILFSSASRAHPCHRRDYHEQKAVVVVKASLPGLPIKRETWKYLRGLGNLYSITADINILTPFRAAYNQERLTIE